MLPVHSPDRARGWSALEMSLDTNELQSSKKNPPKNEIIQFIPWEVALFVLASLPRDGSSPGAASRWSCPWWGRQRADQTPPDLPLAELLPIEYFVPYGSVACSRCPAGNTRWGERAGPGCTRERC